MTSVVASALHVLVNIDRAAALRRGYGSSASQPITITLDLASMTQDQRELVASALDPERNILRQRGGDYGWQIWPITVNEPTLGGIIEALTAADVAYALERARAAEIEAARVAAAAEIAAQREAFAALLAAHPVSAPYQWRVFDGRTSADIAGGGWSTSGHASDQAGVLDHMSQLRDRLAQLASLEEAATRARADRAKWIAEHGSDRLRRMVAEGIGHEETYTTEREEWEQAEFSRALAAAHPGWARCDEEIIGVSDVSDYDLALLDAAQAMIPTARLGEVDEFIVAVATFRGQTIIWPNA